MVESSVEDFRVDCFQVVAIDDVPYVGHVIAPFLLLFGGEAIGHGFIDQIDVVDPVILRVEFKEGVYIGIFETFIDKGKVLSGICASVIGLKSDAGFRVKVDKSVNSKRVFREPSILILSVSHLLVRLNLVL